MLIYHGPTAAKIHRAQPQTHAVHGHIHSIGSCIHRVHFLLGDSNSCFIDNYTKYLDVTIGQTTMFGSPTLNFQNKTISPPESNTVAVKKSQL